MRELLNWLVAAALVFCLQIIAVASFVNDGKSFLAALGTTFLLQVVASAGLFVAELIWVNAISKRPLIGVAGEMLHAMVGTLGGICAAFVAAFFNLELQTTALAYGAGLVFLALIWAGLRSAAVGYDIEIRSGDIKLNKSA